MTESILSLVTFLALAAALFVGFSFHLLFAGTFIFLIILDVVIPIIRRGR